MAEDRRRPVGPASPSRDQKLPTLASPARSMALFVGIVLVLGSLRLLPSVFDIPQSSAVGSVVQTAVLLLGSFAPLWAALIVTARWLGGPGVGVVLRQLRRWRVGAGWYLAAVAGPAVVAAAALAIAVALGVPAPSLGMTALVDAATIFVLAAVFAVAEELGWRGYLQAALQRRTRALTAALIVAAVAALWHTPLFFTPEHVQSGIPPLAFIAWISGVTVVLAAFFNSTGGSIPVVIIAHAAINASLGSIAEQRLVDAASAATYLWVAAAVMWVVAALIVLVAGPRTLSLVRDPATSAAIQAPRGA